MKTKHINLALQGGGAHGAFTWGVLEALLQTPEIEISAMSGTSAGALNGAAVKAGLALGSRQAALDNLEALWRDVGALDESAPQNVMTKWMAPFSVETIAKGLEYSFPFLASDTLSRIVSPYDMGPLYRNPLAPIVARFNYDDVCDDKGPRLHVCATNVRSGKIRVFTGASITPDAIMASACLPTLFQAVEIDGEAYWDGGYTGNPALFPLYAPELPRDIVVVNINPLERADVPRTARDIQNRINEISFNSSLLRELRAISFVKRLLQTNAVPSGAMKDVLVHMIADDTLMTQLSVATKLIATPPVLSELRSAGHRAASKFIDQNFDKIGQQGTVDLEEMFT